MKFKNDFPEIDMVYLWVNGNDAEWIKKKERFTGEVSKNLGTDCKARYIDNDELRHSLRALEKNAPWIRNIFIVTDNQVPHWLNLDNPKIKIIDHKDILPPVSLPCFNSVVIEHCLHKIPGLSEYFLYSNDDMFINQPVNPEDFFTAEGKPIVRLNRRWFRKFWLNYRVKVKKQHLDNYNLTMHRAATLVEKKLGRYIGHKPHHNVDAYRKTQYEETFNLFKEEIESTLRNHLRADSDIQRIIYSLVPIVKGKAKIKFVGDKTSFRCHIEKQHYLRDLEFKNPLLFCVNDSHYATDLDRLNVKKLLERKYPEKSNFEK